MSGFAHDIAGGNGNLVATSVQSPNFSLAPFQGWQITKAGRIYAADIVLPDGTGVSVFFSATPPATTHVGDLWYDIADGLLLSRWDGSAWVPFQIGTGAIGSGVITAALIAANTITASQIAAGTITGTQIAASVALSAPVITGGTITGGTFNGANWLENASGSFFYSGTPAAGNLRASIAPSAGTDAHGNPYLGGVAAYFFSGTTPVWASVLDGGDLNFLIWGGSSWTAGPNIATDASGDLLIAAGPTGGVQVSGATQFVNAIYTATAWTPVTSFSTGFSGATGAAAPQYALMPQGVGGAGSVALRGEILLTGATAADAQMFMLPFTFARSTDYVTPTNLSGYSAGNRVVRVAASGAVRCEPAGSNTNFLVLDGVTAPIS